HSGRGWEEGRILVPGRDEDLGTPRRWVQAADHEAEEPTAGVRGDIRPEVAGELGDDLRRVEACFGGRVVKRGAHVRVLALRVDAAVGQRPQVLERGGAGGVEHRCPVRAMHVSSPVAVEAVATYRLIVTLPARAAEW